MCIFVGNHIIGSGFQRRFKHFVGIGRIGRIFDIADSLKIESHRAALAHNAAAFSENGTDIAGRPVLIVGHCFDDNRYLAGAKPLVTGRNIIVAAGRLAGFGNGAFNIVLRHALGTGGLNGQTQARVFVGFRQTALGGKYARLFGILGTFAIHDVFKLGMSRHTKSP